ncbi:MAG TPA: CRISPR-associated ring nuclease [Spirochaetia bacterium]|nr:CRISPR-associated ring nuclease [Spirochaetia bacterium]
MSIVVSALGKIPEIIVELLGYINQNTFSLYKQHPAYSKIQNDYKEYFQGYEADELWLYSTQSEENVFKNFIVWKQKNKIPVICRCWILPCKDIDSFEHAQQAKELAVRLVGEAHRRKSNAVFISLAAGRKTMTTDLAWAGSQFGCSAFIHILSNSNSEDKNQLQLDFIQSVDTAIDADIIKKYFPYYDGRANKSPLVAKIEEEYASFIEIPGEDESIIITEEHIPPGDFIISKIEKKLTEAANVHANINLSDIQQTFPFLAMYDYELIKRLKNTPLSEDFARVMPKVDLHCHLGGVLSINEIVAIARETLKREGIEKSNITNSFEAIQKIKTSKEKLPYQDVLAILASFSDREHDLEELWYGKYLDAVQFSHIGFEAYEQLGNLQGTTLLQKKTAITLTVQTLLENYKKQHALGLELRCSPYNYTREGLSVTEVIETILQAIENNKGDLEVGLIFIASRHKKMSEVYNSIELYEEFARKKHNDLFFKYFRGFDIAGNEEVRRPSELREAFMPILQDCINVTIHAGETEDAKSIWEAIYYLNADRIGHGLSLANSDESLKKKFLNREIALELCPSSNFQIVAGENSTGFNDYKLNRTCGTVYPLKDFLRRGFKVTINTDNPGISRTSITNEFLKAAAMCPQDKDNMLSMLDAIQLVKNSIEKSFFPYDTKKNLLNTASIKLKKEIDNFLMS